MIILLNSELNFGFLLMKSLEHGTWIEIDIVPRSVPGCWAGCCLVSVRRVTSASVWWWPYSAHRTMRREPYTQSITPSATKEKTHSIIIKEREKVWYNKYHCEMLLPGKLLSKKIHLYPIAQHWTDSWIIKMCFYSLTLNSFFILSIISICVCPYWTSSLSTTNIQKVIHLRITDHEIQTPYYYSS